MVQRGLVGELGLDKFAVEAGDVGYRLVLRADSLAGAGVGAVTEAKLLHLSHHSLSSASSLRTTLWQQGELAHLGAHEEHGGAVLASCYAGTATDAGGAVHSLVSVLLGDEDGVGILGSTGAHGHVTAGSLYLVECGAVDHAVLDNGEGGRTPGFYGDDVAVVEAAHVELAGGGTRFGFAVGGTVDVERAHTADTFAAVVVENNRFFTLFNQRLVEDCLLYTSPSPRDKRQSRMPSSA